MPCPTRSTRGTRAPELGAGDRAGGERDMRRILAAVLAVIRAGGAHAQGGPPGVLQVAVISDVTLNPFTLPQQLPTLMVSKVIFGTLTRYQTGDGKPVGDLAASWKTTDDGRTWEFKLR